MAGSARCRLARTASNTRSISCLARPSCARSIRPLRSRSTPRPTSLPTSARRRPVSPYASRNFRPPSAPASPPARHSHLNFGTPMTDTVNLGLPCIEGSQAQKHVTHNDALRMLDTLVQLAVLDRDLTAPPSSPAEGQRWIVKATGTGAWAGHNNAIAAWQDGAWQFSPQQTGWGDFFATVTSLQNLAMLGIVTTADTTNRLAAKLNNTLFTAKTVAEGGDG